MKFWLALHVFCITEMHHTFGGHSFGSWSQEETQVKINELQSVLKVTDYSQNCVLKFLGRHKQQ